MEANKIDEIDLLEILRKLYKSRKLILYVSIFFLILGVVVSLISPIKYSSSIIFIPQKSDTSNSSLSGVANLVGINFGSQSIGGEIPPSMYPEIGESPKYKRLLLDKIIDKNENLTLKKYIIDYYNLEDNQNKSNSSPLYISELDNNCFKIISDMIMIKNNESDGSVTITTSMPNAEYSAVVANISKEILQQIIIENKIESAKQNLDFSKNQLDEKKKEFDKIQSKLSYFKDSNLNLVNSLIIDEQNKLEAEFQIINAVVTELSKQVEQAKLQVTKDTPVFSTIREATIPILRSSPKRKQIVLVYTLIGFFIASLFILVKDFISNILIEIVKK